MNKKTSLILTLVELVLTLINIVELGFYFANMLPLWCVTTTTLIVTVMLGVENTVDLALTHKKKKGIE